MNLFYAFVLQGLVTRKGNEPVSGTDLRDDLMRRYTQLPSRVQKAIAKKGTIPKVNFYECLRGLQDRGLVAIRREKGIPPTNAYSPTSRGEEVASEFQAIFGGPVGQSRSGTGGGYRDMGGKSRVSLEDIATLSEAMGKKFERWLVEWYEAGLDGEERELSSDRVITYTGELITIVRNELGI